MQNRIAVLFQPNMDMNKKRRTVQRHKLRHAFVVDDKDLKYYNITKKQKVGFNRLANNIITKGMGSQINTTTDLPNRFLFKHEIALNLVGNENRNNLQQSQSIPGAFVQPPVAESFPEEKQDEPLSARQLDIDVEIRNVRDQITSAYRTRGQSFDRRVLTGKSYSQLQEMLTEVEQNIRTPSRRIQTPGEQIQTQIRNMSEGLINNLDRDLSELEIEQDIERQTGEPLRRTQLRLEDYLTSDDNSSDESNYFDSRIGVMKYSPRQT